MPKVKLDASFCSTATCEPGKRRTDYWSDQLPGFVLETRSSGAATFYLRYQDAHGKQRAFKIGGRADVSYENAKKTAQRLRSEVVLGGDPAVAKADKRAIPTYAELSVQHLAHAKGVMKSYDSLETIMRLHIVPRWGRCRLTEITNQGVSKWLGDKTEEGLALATVEKIRVMFGRSFELGRRWGVPGCEVNPSRGVQRPKFDNRRQRFLSSEEAGRLLAAAGKSLNPKLRPIILILLTTGARLSEVLNARSDHIDFERRSWLIPITKTSKSRYVPLAQAAIEAIEKLPKIDGCPWLLPNPETGKPFVTIKHSWQKARKVAGLQGLRLHDLRHTAASQMANSGVPLFTISVLLGHSDLKSSSRYSHLADSTLMAAAEAGASRMSSQWAD